MQILISHSSTGKLLSHNAQPFQLISLLGNFFLLTKAFQGGAVDKNVNFSIQGKQYYSTFARHANLAYSSKLNELVESLSIKNNPALQYEWLVLYEIHDFTTPSQIFSYKLGIPAYGDEVVVHFSKGQPAKTRISNMFRLHGEAFYFISCSPSSCQQLAIITDIQCTTIFGITYFVKDVTICLPFHSISSQKPCPINIVPSIKPLLQSTCYVMCNSNYCTGFILSQNTVISARHLLPFEDQKVGTELSIRFYPYHQQKTGWIKRIGQGSVDIIVIQIEKRIVIKQNASHLQLSNSYEMKVDEQKLVGQQILALGFGRYSYSSKIFHKADIVFPTIQSGIISKIIAVGHQNVFIKTDANLYNGFSGCGVWLGIKLVGMAVFILKNKNNHSHFNKHNFSYLLKFIMDLLKQNNDELLISQLNAQLSNFDRIQTRHHVNIYPKL